MRRWTISLLLAAACLHATRAQAQPTLLFLNSQPGDYIGGGLQQTFTPLDGSFTVNRNVYNGVSVSFIEPGYIHSWYLDFAAPGKVPLAPGAYDSATRYPFQASTAPGLSVAGDGSGCNTLTGRFDVLEVAYGPDGGVTRFAADFEQHCDGMGPALFGSIRINSGAPLTIEFAVYRASTGEWFIHRALDDGTSRVLWGAPASTGLGDVPVPGDYDGDGLADLAIYRASTGEWFIHRSTDNGLTHVAWGAPALGDVPVPGDYDGDHKTDIAVYRGSTGEWFIRRSSDGGLTHVTWGAPALGDIPVPAKYPKY
jgi:hypothetical protein